MEKNEENYFNCCNNQILLCHSKYMHKHFLANPLAKIIFLFYPDLHCDSSNQAW